MCQRKKWFHLIVILSFVNFSSALPSTQWFTQTFYEGPVCKSDGGQLIAVTSHISGVCIPRSDTHSVRHVCDTTSRAAAIVFLYNDKHCSKYVSNQTVNLNFCFPSDGMDDGRGAWISSIYSCLPTHAVALVGKSVTKG